MKERKVIGIGNAIIDIVCEVDDEFLLKNNLIKGSMSLIDENMDSKLSELPHVKINSGGSVGNSIATISQLGNPSSFIGKTALDNLGRKFVAEIEKSGTDYVSQDYSDTSSAKSYILVTKDAERTMCTFLGCASEINEEDIRSEDIKNHKILYLEGYLWDQGSTTEALKKAIEIAKSNNVKIAFTLSDIFCVARHKADFLSLIENDLDILFANEQEIIELLDLKILEKSKIAEFFAKNPKLTAIVTRGENGFITFEPGKIQEEKAYKVAKVIDTTGAGDAFAAGFLDGISNGKSAFEAGQKGNLYASRIIQKFGGRFEDHELKNL